MEPFMFIMLLISIIGILIIFGLSYVKIESNTPNQFYGGNQDFNSFMTKVKGNLSKVRR